jgi:hypothetical protein
MGFLGEAKAAGEALAGASMAGKGDDKNDVNDIIREPPASTDASASGAQYERKEPSLQTLFGETPVQYEPPPPHAPTCGYTPCRRAKEKRSGMTEALTRMIRGKPRPIPAYRVYGCPGCGLLGPEPRFNHEPGGQLACPKCGKPAEEVDG